MNTVKYQGSIEYVYSILKDILRGDMIISDFNKREIEDMIIDLCVE